MTFSTQATQEQRDDMNRAAAEIRDDATIATRCVRPFLLEVANWLEKSAARWPPVSRADPAVLVSYAYLKGERMP